MLYQLFTVGGFEFWIVTLALFCFWVWMTEWEYWGTAAATFAAAVLAIALLSDVNMLHLIWTHKIETVVIIIAYFIPVGIAVGILKWWLYVLETREKNREHKTYWLGKIQNSISQYNRYQNGDEYKALHKTREEFDAVLAGLELAKKTGQMNEAIFPLWKAEEKTYYWTDWLGHDRGITKPLASDNKARIINWIAWWPVVGFWLMLHDPITRFSRFLYYRIAALLQQISDWTWKNEDTFTE